MGITGIVNATTIDFEDLTESDQYLVGNTIVTSGITLVAMPFQWSDLNLYFNGFAIVDNSGKAGGLGNEMRLNNISLFYRSDFPVSELSLNFGEYGGNLNININGDFLNFENFSDVDGWITPGGILVTVSFTNVTAVDGYDMGVLSLYGPITSFSLGGQELWIDNVSAVPLPGGLVLIGSGLFGIIGIRRQKLFLLNILKIK